MATESSQGPKPAITLGSANSGLVRRAKDLFWFLRFWFGSVPNAARFWIALLVTASLLSTAQIWLARALIDSVSNHAERVTWLFFALTVGVIGAETFAQTLARYQMAIIRERGVPFLQAAVLQQSTEISLEAYESSEFYDATNRLAKQLASRAEECIHPLAMILTMGPAFFGNMILLWIIDWRAALLMPLPAIPMVAIGFIFGDRIWGFVREQTREVRITEYLAEQLTSRQPAKEIRLFGLQDLLILRWSKHFLETRRGLRRLRFRNQLRGQIIANLFAILPFAVVCWLVYGTDGSFSNGDILILVTLQTVIVSSLSVLSRCVHDLAEFSGFATDLRALRAMPVVFAGDAVSRKQVIPQGGSITFENVSFRYPGSVTDVLTDLSFQVEPGQHAAIVGENGAGKTTLIKLALGLYEPDEGQILLDGRPLTEIPMNEKRALFSAVFQQFTRYPLTVEENLILDRPELSHKTEMALEEVEMLEALQRLPDGLQTILSPDLGGVDLSGGQWQRMAIARAALRDAKVLALDEPTAALDPMAEIAIFQRFNHISEGRTTLLVSHRLGMARLAERILVLEHGRLAEDGSHPELLKQDGVYADLWHAQSRWYL